MKCIMRKFILLLCLAGLVSIAPAADTVFVPARESRVLDQVVLDFSRCADRASVAAVKLYYGGVEARQDEGKNRFAPVGYISSFSAGKTLSAYPSYSVKCAEVTNPDKRVVLQADYELYPGVNFFWVSLQMKPGTSLSAKVGAELASVSLDGKKALCHRVSPDGIVHRMGIGVRHAGNDGAAAFRIPGLVTCNCKKSRCLKLYCECFKSQEYCSSECNCLNCYNNRKHESEREEAVQRMKARNPHCFENHVDEKVETWKRRSDV